MLISNLQFVIVAVLFSQRVMKYKDTNLWLIWDCNRFEEFFVFICFFGKRSH